MSFSSTFPAGPRTSCVPHTDPATQKYITAEAKVRTLLTRSLDELYLCHFTPEFISRVEAARTTYEQASDSAEELLKWVEATEGFELDMRIREWRRVRNRVSNGSLQHRPIMFNTDHTLWEDLKQEWDIIERLPYFDTNGQPPFQFHPQRRTFMEKLKAFFVGIQSKCKTLQKDVKQPLDSVGTKISSISRQIKIDGLGAWDITVEHSDEQLNEAVRCIANTFTDLEEGDLGEAYKETVWGTLSTSFRVFEKLKEAIVEIRLAHEAVAGPMLKEASSYVTELATCQVDLCYQGLMIAQDTEARAVAALTDQQMEE